MIKLSLKSNPRKDGKSRRCRKCASCKHRCGECQSCVSDNKKAKSGCKKRVLCLTNSSLVDEPDLLTESPLKRLREDDLEEGTSFSKGLKLSKSIEEAEAKTGDSGHHVDRAKLCHLVC